MSILIIWLVPCRHTQNFHRSTTATIQRHTEPVH